ncbi:hypothetical protein [Nocardioides sp.]|uniref:hypothetical protein n=1 Tax=Nocardioides sp. TaxID=35761 RepID=UPI002735D3A2|nr:hypothetical protein [Nocardioides sp.]MDP3893074.1 hypothetical protein [Nocardioides sp.]
MTTGMNAEIEEMLVRELHEVAGGVRVPPLPALSTDAPRPRAARPWQPLLVAAAVALLVGLVAIVVGQQGGDAPQPAPSPSPSVSDPTVSGKAPTVPHLLDRRLYVDGVQVPGEWWGLEARGQVWLAVQSDGSWWWSGPGVDVQRIDAQIEQAPAISPDGGYIAFIDVSSGAAHLTGFDTQPAGEGFGPAPIDNLPVSEEGVALGVAAVTDQGDVIVQGARTRLMWRAQFEDQRTVVDLPADQRVLQATPGGLVVVDESDGPTDAATTQAYLATVSGDGRLTEVATLPTYDDLVVNPGGTWLARSPAGSLGGEVSVVGTLRAQEIGAEDEVVLEAPEGWGFANGTWAWEDDEHLIATLLPDREGGDAQLVRCHVPLGACRTIRS